MPKNFYGAIALTGGGAGALDAIDGADLADLDGAVVITQFITYTYTLDVDSAAGESSPDVIAPDDNPGDKRWILVGISSTNPLGGDGTAGRILRIIVLTIDNGTNAATLKCTVVSEWNGDAIAQTDNIAKDATTGNFWLRDDGKQLKILASGLTGNGVGCTGMIRFNASTIDVTCEIDNTGNDILITLYNTAAGVTQDMTALVDTGALKVGILYITDA